MTAPIAAAAPALEARALRLADARRKHVLDPVDRFSEIIFGLVMVLGFTGTVSVAEGGREELRDVLAAALACNVAWGLVDGLMYVITSVVERARRHAVLAGIRAAGPEGARAVVRAALPEGVAAVADEADVERLAARIRAGPPPAAPRLEWGDLAGAAWTCLLVILATLPPVVPFLLARDVGLALRVSNGVAVACLFVAGWSLGKATGVRPVALGGGMVILGGALVAITIALGG